MLGRHLDPLTDSRQAAVEQTYKITITQKIRKGLCTIQLKISCQTSKTRIFNSLKKNSKYKKKRKNQKQVCVLYN